MSILESSRTVALVGRPNVGKSRLFNRLTGRRLSIVHDQPGVTRDVISAEVGDAYCLLDTGGIGMDLEQTPQRIAHAAEDQVEFALQAAQVILFVVDAQSGITTLDERVAEKLRRYAHRFYWWPIKWTWMWTRLRRTSLFNWAWACRCLFLPNMVVVL